MTFFPTRTQHKLSVFIHLKNRICVYDAKSKVISTNYHLDPLIVQATEKHLSTKRDGRNEMMHKMDYLVKEMENNKNILKSIENIQNALNRDLESQRMIIAQLTRKRNRTSQSSYKLSRYLRHRKALDI